MESGDTLHPYGMTPRLYLRLAMAIVLGLICIYGGQTRGQSDSLMATIAQDINSELRGSCIRGKLEAFWISKHNDEIKLEGLSNQYTPNKTLEAILFTYADSLAAGEEYVVRIYYDKYSDIAYTSFSKRYKSPGVFPNFDNYWAQTKGGLGVLIKTIYNDISSHRPSIDSLRFSDAFRAPLQFIIDSTGIATVTGDSSVLKVLNDTHDLPWQPGIHHGHPRGSMISIRLARPAIWNENEAVRAIYIKQTDISHAYLLPEKYQNRWVSFGAFQTEPQGRTMESKVVSFVFNPFTKQIENPVIHQGPPEETLEFIKWLTRQHLPVHLFYWDVEPIINRTFFYID